MLNDQRYKPLVYCYRINIYLMLDINQTGVFVLNPSSTEHNFFDDSSGKLVFLKGVRALTFLVAVDWQNDFLKDVTWFVVSYKKIMNLY